MKKYNFITKKLLLEEYTKKRKSARRIASELNCSCVVIYNKLRKFDIKIRTNKEAHTGELGANYKDGRTLKAYCCVDCQKQEISYNTWYYGNGRCQSCAVKKLNWVNENNPNFGKKHPGMNKGKRNGMFGKTPRYKIIKYRNIWMRSSWEVAYAKYLDRLGIRWQYEPKRFDLGNTTYAPDFYLPKEKIYVEIKGWMSPKAYEKLKKFIEQFPEKKLLVLRQKELKKSGVL